MQLYAEEKESVLIELDEQGQLFSQCRFAQVDGAPVILGQSDKSTVYEMYDIASPEKRYALKVKWAESHEGKASAFWDAVNIQKRLEANTPYVVTTYGAKEFTVERNEAGEVAVKERAIEPNASGEIGAREEAEVSKELVEQKNAICLQLVLQEKLQCLIKRDSKSTKPMVLARIENIDDVYIIACEIGCAISVMHENAVLHRDIKLENVFWDEEKQIYKLGDFDVAKQSETLQADTVVFTSGYRAPELVLRSETYYDARADIYSFGIMLYVLLNRLCFPYSDGYEESIIQHSPEYAFPAPVDATPAFASLIRKITAFRPQDRPDNMCEVLKLILTAIDADVRMQNNTAVTEVTERTTELAMSVAGGRELIDVEIEAENYAIKWFFLRLILWGMTLGLGAAVGGLIAKDALVIAMVLMIAGVTLLAHFRDRLE